MMTDTRKAEQQTAKELAQLIAKLQDMGEERGLTLRVEQIEKMITRFAASQVQEQREMDCKAMCNRCELGIVVKQDEQGWYHDIGDEFRLYSTCKASAIRSTKGGQDADQD
jgi:hypothetical protein